MTRFHRLQLHMITAACGLALFVGCSQNSGPSLKTDGVQAGDKSNIDKSVVEKSGGDKSNLDKSKSDKAEGGEKPPVVDPKGRRILTAAEAGKAPYCYFGRVVTAKHPNAIGGAGALIGRRHIVTAAHVIEDADKIASKAPILFVLPDGQRSEIEHAELDGGFRKLRFTSYDFAVCTLKEPLKGGHAAWGVFEDADFGKTMMLAGFDQDLAGATRPPPMIVRSGTASRHQGGHVITALGAVALLDGARRGRMFQTALGAGAIIEGQVLQAHLYVGWKAYFSAAEGASGGPLWIDRDGVPTVVGVQSHAFDADKDRVGEFCLGSRISPGAAEAMVRDHIKRNP